MKFYTETELIRSGQNPDDLPERPVACAVIRALDTHRRSCFLFKTDENRRLTLIGGVQEAVDDGDYSRTIRRYLSEERAITQVSLTRLNYKPIVGYAVSDTTGELARYPCVFYGVVIDGRLNARPSDTWLTEAEIANDSEYFAFLLEGTPSRISRVPLSTWECVRPGSDGTHRLP